MKSILSFFCSVLFLCCSIEQVHAQWTINPSGLLETDGSFGVGYRDVIITNYFGVNMGVTPDLLLPATTGATTPTVAYPLTVNGTMVLWNATSDIERDLIGLSQKGAVAVFSGDNDRNGSGIRLNARSGTIAGGIAGCVQTISSGASSPTNVALQHLDWDPSAAAMNSLLKLYTNGDIDLTGKLKFNMLGGDVAYREIQGLSSSYGLNIYTNSTSTNGPSIHLAGSSTSTPNLMQFLATGSASGISPSFDFMTSSTVHALRINNNGNMRIGNATAGPTGTDKLTLDGNLFMATPTPGTDVDRIILAKSSTGALNLTAGAVLDGSDGPCLNAYATTSTVTGADPGAMRIRSRSVDPDPTTHAYKLGFGYSTYHPTGWAGEGTPGPHDIFLIHDRGQAILGIDASLSNIHTFDVLSVKNSLGFWTDMPNSTMSIRGHAGTMLYIGANNDKFDGGAIELNTTGTGEVNFYSLGTSGNSSTFYNLDRGSGLHHSNLIINNAGQTIIGKDITTTATGDVLTVLNQIGLTNATSTATGTRAINGNAEYGSMALRAQTSATNGPSIELYGQNMPAAGTNVLAGRVNYTSYGNSGYGHMFANYDPSGTYNARMAITNDGRVIIGNNLLDDGITHARTGHPYRLYVQDGILTEHIRVAISTSLEWADYVFDNNYDLLPLNKLASYVNKHKHLPEMPTAKEVEKNGVDVGEMQAELLKKIEELTLYVIQQQKQINELTEKVNSAAK